jgi:DNA-binding FadR family transcriptional regulator
MKNLKIQETTKTLVDIVEEKLRDYFVDKNIKIGEPIPSELELANALGVARSVVREAISRLKMLGMVQSRTRRGMILCEPNLYAGIERVLNPTLMGTDNILDVIGLRITMEIGCADFIFQNITDKDIEELEEIIAEGKPVNNMFGADNDSRFHAKLYEISGNRTLFNLQEIFSPLFGFARKNLVDEIEKLKANKSEWVSHRDLLDSIKEGDISKYQRLMKKHLQLYFDYMEKFRDGV